MADQLIALGYHPLVKILAPMIFQPLILETSRRVRNRRRIDFHNRLSLIHRHKQLLPLCKIHRLQRPQNPVLENDMDLALHASL